MSGTFSVSFTYAHDPAASFDIDYYLKTHMPLVESHWKQYGLLGYKVIQFDVSDASNPPPLRVVCVSSWKDEASWQAAIKSPEMPTVMADVPNFTTIPVKPYAGTIY
ncbi:hypothetical protein BROUX41_003070 [Berkeleyomyces rouxiae]|uniref:uncharacterized protein n=1 Tax=Berkeleyomyces rouxiae TaxID=2035830 RepID=UPI003B78E490